MVLLTVFTPAYNRAHTLPRTYESLKKQHCKNFVWLVVDDGSTDNTRELVEKWIQEDDGFEIRYVYKENGGMHTAHNVAYENITTELNVCIDSDDCLADGAVDKILTRWQEVKNKGYAGLIALDSDFSGKIIGTTFAEGIKETNLSEFYANGGRGDKKLIYRTDVINKYPPYPVFENEKYVSLSYKYVLIDRDYKLAVLNDVVCNVEYQEDGSTRTMWKQYLNNPKGFAFFRKICIEYPPSEKKIFIDCIHYVSSSIFAKNRRFVQESPRKIMTIAAIPFGIILNIIVRYKAKR